LVAGLAGQGGDTAAFGLGVGVGSAGQRASTDPDGALG
jgi:hypothetical protein